VLHRQRGLSGENTHRVLVGGLRPVVVREVEERFEAGERRSDEVHEVVAGESHSQRERAEEHYEAEDIDVEEVENLGEKSEHHEAY
jgi:hypothetical protein